MEIFDLYIASATFNIMSDIAMYLIPLWKIWHLHISPGRKMGISVIFATGSLAIICGAFRLFFSIRFLYTQDYSHVKVQAIAFTLAEASFGLICSSIFVLPRLYRHLTSMPPFKSEEYQLRKYKKLATHVPRAGQPEIFDDSNSSVKRAQEGRNTWEHDVEAPVGLPEPVLRGSSS